MNDSDRQPRPALGRLGERGRTQVRRVRRVVGDNLDLRRRVAALEEEVQECRQLNLRVAELCDVVSELLVPLAERDEAAAAAAIQRYRTQLDDSLEDRPTRAGSLDGHGDDG